MKKVSEFELVFTKGPLGFTVETPPENGKPGAIVTRIKVESLSKKLKVQSVITKINKKNVSNLPLKAIVGMLTGIIKGKKWPLTISFRPPRDHMAGGKPKKSPRKNNPKQRNKPKRANKGRQSGAEKGGQPNGQAANRDRQDGNQNANAGKPGNRDNNNNQRRNNDRRGRQGPTQQQQNDGNDRQNTSPRKPNKKKVRSMGRKQGMKEHIYQEGDRVEGAGSGSYQGKWFPGTITSVKYAHEKGFYQYTIEYDQTKGKEYTIRARHLRPLDPHSAAARRPEPQQQKGPAARQPPVDDGVELTRLKFIYYGQYGSNVPTQKVVGLSADEDGLYGITHAAIANMQSNILSSFSPALPQQITITDGTAGLGGNTHSFAKFFRYVRAVEVNAPRFEKLKNNMDILKCAKRVNCVNGNVLDEMAKNNDSKILFLDAPWGGQSYREKEVLDINLKDSKNQAVSIATVCNQVRESNPEVELIGLKLPFNYDQEHMLRTVYNCNIAEFQFSYTRIRTREDISQVLVLLDYHHNSKDFSLVFDGVAHRNKYVNAEILRRKTFVDSKEVAQQLEKMKEDILSALQPTAEEFVPHNKRHALRGEVAMLD